MEMKGGQEWLDGHAMESTEAKIVKKKDYITWFK